MEPKLYLDNRVKTQGRINNEKLKKLFKNQKNFYAESPFLSIVEDLILALKEGLIEELVTITCFRKGKHAEYRDPNKVDARKEEKFQKTFAKFPHCKFEATALVGLDSKKTDPRPYRWEVLRDKYPDFDIFIDDNSNIINKTGNFFADHSEKIYFLPDYKPNRHV